MEVSKCSANVSKVRLHEEENEAGAGTNRRLGLDSEGL